MKKKILCVLLVVILAATFLCGCNKQVFDVTYSFDRAILTLPNGDVIEGNIKSWKDFEDGDQIQVVIDGKTYLVHSSDIVMIKE